VPTAARDADRHAFELEPFDLDRLHPRIRALYEHWKALPREAGGELPARKSFDPMRVHRLLPGIWLLDVVRAPAFRLRFRLVGTKITTVMGFEPTGKWLDEARPRALTPGYLDRYKATVETGRASWRRGPPIFDETPAWREIESICLPFAANGRDVDILMCKSVYYGADGREL
jgi:hypothetical protein